MIIPITSEEFQIAICRNTAASTLTKALMKLEPNEGFKTECVFTHYKGGNCGGSIRANGASHRLGYTVKTRCKDGTLYIWRGEDG